jgi:hypothetical protein
MAILLHLKQKADYREYVVAKQLRAHSQNPPTAINVRKRMTTKPALKQNIVIITRFR